MSSASSSSTLIGRFEHLAKQSHAERAKELLLKTASLVKPIMKKHDWKVGTLAEFLPSNPALLGLNMDAGKRILLRLRPAHAPDTFYDQEQIVLVMLHELTHNVHGPHDNKFYKMLGELEEEWYDLKRKGYSGDGFFSDGARLGGFHDVPQHIGRIKALEAAEKRAARSRLLGKGGRLGGDRAVPPPQGKKSMRELLAEAAERRIKDDRACQHGDSVAIQEEVRKAAAASSGEDAQDMDQQASTTDSQTSYTPIAGPSVVVADKPPVPVIDLTGEDSESDSQAPHEGSPAKSSDSILGRLPTHDERSGKATTALGSLNSTHSGISDKNGQSADKEREGQPGPAWSCSQCTLLNDPSFQLCLACENPRPESSPPVLRLRPRTLAPTTWICPICTLINDPLVPRCAACDGPRPIPGAQAHELVGSTTASPMIALQRTGFHLDVTNCPIEWPTPKALQKPLENRAGGPISPIHTSLPSNSESFKSLYAKTLYLPELLSPLARFAEQLGHLIQTSDEAEPVDFSPMLLTLPRIEAKHRKGLFGFIEDRIFPKSTRTTSGGVKPNKESQPAIIDAVEYRYLAEGMEIRATSAAADNDPASVQWRNAMKSLLSPNDGEDSLETPDRWQDRQKFLKKHVKITVEESERREVMLQLILVLAQLVIVSARPQSTGSQKKRKRSGPSDNLDLTNVFDLWRLADILGDRLTVWQAVGSQSQTLEFGTRQMELRAKYPDWDEWDWIQKFCVGVIEPRFYSAHPKFVSSLHLKLFGKTMEKPLPPVERAGRTLDQNQASDALGDGLPPSLADRQSSADPTVNGTNRLLRASSVTSELERELQREMENPRSYKRSTSTKGNDMLKSRQIGFSRAISTTSRALAPSASLEFLERQTGTEMTAIRGKRKTLFVPRVQTVTEETEVVAQTTLRSGHLSALVEATPAKPRSYSYSSFGERLGSRQYESQPLPYRYDRQDAFSISAVNVLETPQQPTRASPVRFRPGPHCEDAPVALNLENSRPQRRRGSSISIDFNAPVNQQDLEGFMIESDDEGTGFVGVGETPRR